MAGSLIDLFPPEVHMWYGMIAGLSALAGLLVWGAGIRIARICAATLLGLSVAALAAWVIPAHFTITPFPAGIMGFVAGILVGAVTFRLLQSIALALCLAIAVTGGYYRWQVMRPAAVARATTVPATLAAKDMLISSARLEQTPLKTGSLDVPSVVNTAQLTAEKIRSYAQEQWQSLAPMHRQQITALAGLAALFGLILALTFPRYTTWITTAVLGTVLVGGATIALMQVYAPQYQSYIPQTPLMRLGVAAVMVVVGMLLQRLFFWPKDRPKTNPLPQLQRPV